MRLTGEKRNVLRSDIKALYASDFGRAARRYLFVGGASAVADWVLFALMLYGFDLHYIVAGTISFILATALNYFLSVRFVFGASRRGARNAMILVYAVSSVGIAINLAVPFHRGRYPWYSSVACQGRCVWHGRVLEFSRPLLLYFQMNPLVVHWLIALSFWLWVAVIFAFYIGSFGSVIRALLAVLF